MLYEGQAELTRWVDGDTVELTIGVYVPLFDETISQTKTMRLKGVNCPELHDPDTDKKIRAEKAKAFSQLTCPPGTYKVQIPSFDKYRRWCGDVTTTKGQQLTTLLLNAGHAVPVRYGCESE